jgi:2-polyprenyl-3-methyl-5-hydroxy-6-metoxy-1,4-benzoquinol methylase
MREWLDQAGYSIDDSDGVWCRADYAGIPYSDGDEVEQRIQKAILEAQDKSLFSRQLAEACVDWPSYYHLSCTRANLLRPLQQHLEGADVLEVGAGCGAITRFLGEMRANVCALEGSRRRARVTRLRTIDLTNVSVVSENFETFTSEQKFDVITFVGVLEYANQFVGGEVPAVTMLNRARSMLKPGGIVIIAIENQLGLKYFAGAPEDHVSRRMFGIEDRYSDSSVRTYGREDLAKLLKMAGFSDHHFYAPFPDYKFPITVFSQDGLMCPDLGAHSIVQSSIHADRQLTQFLSFDLSKAWDVVIRNNLGMDLANSFLVVAGDREIAQQPILAWHYSTGRAPHFCKEILFEQRQNAILLRPRLINAALRNPTSDTITISLPDEVPFVRGSQLSDEFAQLLTTEGWSIKDVASLTKRFLTIAEGVVKAEGVYANLSSADSAIPGKYLDLIPQNIIDTGNGDFVCIDREWNYGLPVNAGWLVFRAFCGVFATNPVFAASVSDLKSTRFGFMTALFDALGFVVTEEKIWEIARQEAQLQTLVAGISADAAAWGPDVRITGTHQDGTNPIYSFESIVQKYQEMRNAQSTIEALRGQISAQEEAFQAALNELQAQVSAHAERIEQQKNALASLEQETLSLRNQNERYQA